MLVPAWITSRAEYADLPEILIAEAAFKDSARVYNYREKPFLVKVVELLVKRHTTLEEHMLSTGFLHEFEAEEQIVEGNDEVKNFHLLIQGEVEFFQRSYRGPKLIENIMNLTDEFLRLASTPVYYRKSIIAKSRCYVIRWPLRAKKLPAQEKISFFHPEMLVERKGIAMGKRMQMFYENFKVNYHRAHDLPESSLVKLPVTGGSFSSPHKFLSACFPDIAKTLIDRLITNAEVVHVHAKTPLVAEGQLLLHIYGLMAGEARVTYSATSRPSTRASEASDKIQSTKVLKSGKWVGISTSDPAPFSAVTSGDAIVFKIARKSIEAVIGFERLHTLLANW
jgi:hypothetical protein